MALDSYVSPAVIDAYLDGRTLDDFRDTNGRPPRRNLTADERALVRLLRAAVRAGSLASTADDEGRHGPALVVGVVSV